MWANILWVTALVVIVLASSSWWRRRSGRRPATGYPYARRERLLSPDGRRFLNVLDDVAGNDARVFAQVRMTDVIRVTHRPGSGYFARALARISERRFDFVVCDRESLAVLCAVTLDERKRDAGDDAPFAQSFAAQMCRFAGLPLLRVISRRDYDMQHLGERVAEAILRGRAQDRAADTAVTMAHAVDLSAASPSGNGEAISGDAKADPASRQSILTPTLMANITHRSRCADGAPACPRCGATMLRRGMQVGTRPGGEFWGCSRFPVCRAVVPVAEPGSRAG